MRDRVCLTCRYWRKDADYPDVLGNCGYSVMTARENCRQWTERTDSVEQIALDMLALIKAARTHPIVLDPNKMPGGQILMPLPETEFADRLRAQGIEVPE